MNKKIAKGVLMGMVIFELVSCGRNTTQPLKTDSTATSKSSESPYTIDSAEIQAVEYKGSRAKKDSNTLKDFWNTSAILIIQQQKNLVIQHTSFPLVGEWYQMVTGQGMSVSKTDFIKVYDKLFNSEVRKLLSKQTHNDVSVFRHQDYIEYSFGVSKDYFDPESKEQLGGGGVIFRYRKTNDTFKLYAITGIGGNFYDIK